MQPDSLIGLVGNLGAVGFVIWLAHRLTAKTIPEMTRTFTSATERQRDDFRATLKDQREAYETSMQRVMDKCIAGGKQ